MALRQLVLVRFKAVEIDGVSHRPSPLILDGREADWAGEVRGLADEAAEVHLGIGAGRLPADQASEAEALLDERREGLQVRDVDDG